MTITDTAVQYRITIKFLNGADGKNTAVLRNTYQTGADMGVTLRHFGNIAEAVATVQAEYQQLGYIIEDFTIEHTPTADYDVHTATGTILKSDA